MNEYRDIAKVVDKSTSERLRGTVSTRPLRLAFLVHEDLTYQQLSSIIEYNCSLWGGFYNCFIPTDGISISRKWSENLELQNADVVVTCGTDQMQISPQLIEELKLKHDAFTFREWKYWQKEFVDRHRNGVQDDNGVPAVAILLDQTSKNLPIQEDKSNASVFSWPEDSPYYTLLAARFGVLSGFYNEWFVELFKAKTHAILKEANLFEYLRLIKDLDGRFTPISLAQSGLKGNFPLTPFQRPQGLNIFLVGLKPVSDICMFWNYKLAPNIFGPNRELRHLVLPLESLRRPLDLAAFAEIIKTDKFWHAMNINLFSATVTTRRIKSLKQRLLKELGNGYSISRQKEFPPIVYGKIFDHEDVIDVFEENGKFSFKKTWPKFGEEVRSGAWVNEISISDTNNRAIGFPDSSKLNELLCGSVRDDLLNLMGGYWIRQSPNGLACRVYKGTRYVEGRLVSKLEAFSAFFADKGLNVKLNKNHSYAEGFRNLLTSIGGAIILGQGNIRKLFWSLSRLDKPSRIGELRSLLSVENDIAIKTIDNFILAGILIRGVEFICENCGLKHWYAVKSVDETMTCVGCLKVIRLPLFSSFTFRLNQLIKTAVSLGV